MNSKVIWEKLQFKLHEWGMNSAEFEARIFSGVMLRLMRSKRGMCYAKNQLHVWFLDLDEFEWNFWRKIGRKSLGS